MSKKVFDFRKDLETKGKTGEEEFLNSFPVGMKKLSGRDADFITTEQETIELKTDYYKNSSNFFFERWSDKDRKTPGGPWQADLKHTEYYVYWFYHKRVYYIFKTVELVQFLDAYIQKHNPRMIDVPNKGYITQGFVVPISKLEALSYEVAEDGYINKTNTLKSGYGG